MDFNLLKKEVYIIPADNKTLVYAPLTRMFCFYDGIINNVNDIDHEWLDEAMDISNIPAFVKKGFSCDLEKIKLRLNITNKCNLHCSYCSIGDVLDKQDMSKETGLRVMEQFIKYAKSLMAKEIEVTFSGGEPTLNLSLIKEIINYTKSNLTTDVAISFRIITNGLFSQKKIKDILDDIDGIQVSWDGNFPDNPRYGGNKILAEKVRENIRFLCENEIPPSILAVVSESNYLFFTGDC